MKKLVHKVLSVITAFVMVFLSMSSAFTTAYAASAKADSSKATPDSPESSLTEQTLTATVYTDDTYKTILSDDETEITLTGKMPEGAVVKAYPVEYDLTPVERNDEPKANTAPDTEGSVLLSYDITIFDGKKEFEPDGDTISVTFKSPEIEKFADNELSAIHVKDNGEEEQIVEKSADNDELTITADSFSVFVIVKHENGEVVEPVVIFHYLDYRYTTQVSTIDGQSVTTYTASPYYFDSKSTATPKVRFSTQIVRNGEKLEHVPTPPDNNTDSSHFNGWYVVEPTSIPENESDPVTYTWPAETPRQVFDKTVTVDPQDPTPQGTPVTWSIEGENELNAYYSKVTHYADKNGAVHVYLAPLYVNYRFVKFYDYDRVLIAKKLLVLDSRNSVTMLISDMEASKMERDFHFMGWSTVPFNEADYDSTDPNVEKQDETNTISIYQGGYKRETYITLVQRTVTENGQEKTYIDIYDGKSSDGNPSISIESNGGDDVNLYAEYEKAHWLKFIAGETGWGAMYVPADYLVGKAPATNLTVTTRPGYIFRGWCVGYQDAKGKIIYQTDTVNGVEQPRLVTDGDGNVVNDDLDIYDLTSEAKQLEYANLAAIQQADKEKTGYVEHDAVSTNTGKLRTDLDTFLYAYWVPEQETTYSVVVWKQKVTDAVGLPDDKKTYDYYTSVLVTEYTENEVDYGIPSDQVIEDTIDKTIANQYFHIDGNDTTSQYYISSFKGFHFSRNDDLNIRPDPQGSTVINIYYDRNVRTLTFNTGSGKNNNNYSNTANGYAYTKTTDNTGTQYAFMPGESGGQVVQLTKDGDDWIAPVYGYEYTPDNNGNYVKVGDDYVPLSPITTDTITYNYTTTLTAGNEYLIVSRNGAGSGYALGYSGTTVASDAITVVSGSPNYINSSDVDSTSVWTVANGYTFQNGNYYLRKANNNSLSIGTQSSTWSYTTRNNNCRLYKDTYDLYFSNNSFSLSKSEWCNVHLYQKATSQVVSGYTYDNNGTTVTYTNEQRYSPTYNQIGATVYTGDRYTRTGPTSNAHLVFVIKALYGQSLSHYFPIPGYATGEFGNGERWLPQNDSVWSQVLAYVDTMPDRDVTFILDKGDSSTSIKHLNYYVEALPGVAPEVTYNNTGFVKYTTINAKYGFFMESEDYINIPGFSKSTDYPPVAYNNGSQVSQVWGSGSNATDIYCYYLRNTYKFTLNVNYPPTALFDDGKVASDSSLASENQIYDVPYDQVLTAYGNTNGNNGFVPNAPSQYKFEGWYKDAKCTQKFDFSTEKMPDGNKVAYAKWYPVYYKITLEPDGGEIAGEGRENESTYFWLQLGQTIGRYNIKREYIEAEGVTSPLDPSISPAATLPNDNTQYYYYRNVSFKGYEHSRTVYGAGDQKTVYIWERRPNEAEYKDEKDYEGIRPSMYREARYIEVEKYHTAEDTFYQNLVDGFKHYYNFTDAQARQRADAWDEDYTDLIHVYKKPASGDKEWMFVGWNRVKTETDPNTNQTVERLEPYNFGDEVNSDVVLRAEWRLTGAYYIHYKSDMTAKEINTKTSVVGDLMDTNDPLLKKERYDPIAPPEAGQPQNTDVIGYADLAETHGLIAPSESSIHDLLPNSPNEYFFEGWRYTNKYGIPITLNSNGEVVELLTSQQLADGENYATPYSELIQPSERFTVKHEYADEEGVIYLEAYYKLKSDSIRLPDVTRISLDPNKDHGNGKIDPNGVAIPPGFSPGFYSIVENIQSGEDVKKIVFSDTQENNDIHLYDYRNYFVSRNGFFLLGFDPNADPENLSTGNKYIPAYPADAVLGIDNEYLPNYLYAMWEPMVYATFVNTTSGKITIDISDSTDTSVILVNDATQIYDRTNLTNVSHIDVESGQTIKIVLPKAYDEQTNQVSQQYLDIKFRNTNPGYALRAVVDDHNPALGNNIITGATIIGDHGRASVPSTQFPNNIEDSEPSTYELQYKSEYAHDRRELYISNAGLKYTFTEEALDTVKFNVNGGKWRFNYKVGSVQGLDTASPAVTSGNNPNSSSKYTVDPDNHEQFIIERTDLFNESTNSYNTDQIPTDPQVPSVSGKNYIFMGWTRDEVIAKIHDFSRNATDNEIDHSQVITETEERNHLKDIVHNYRRRFNIPDSQPVILYDAVIRMSMHEWTSAPGGYTLYAVYAEATTVNFHLMDIKDTNNSNHEWTESSNEYVPTNIQDFGKTHNVRTITVVKGQTISKPKQPTYNGNSTYTFLYWLEYDTTTHTTGANYTHTPVDDPSILTPYDFSEPTHADTLDLYTSWSGRKNYTVTINKRLTGTYPGSNDTSFNFRYYIDTVKYTAPGGIKRRVNLSRELDSSSEDYIASVVSSVTLTPNSQNNNITLFYWTDGAALYVQTIRLSEMGYEELGYTLTVTTGSGNTVDNGQYVSSGDYYEYDPFYNFSSSNPFLVLSSGGSNPKWEYLGTTSQQNPVFQDNKWYPNSSSTSVTTAPSELNVTTVFNNHRDYRIRFIKLAEGGVYRLNDGIFKIERYNNDQAIQNSKLDLKSRTYSVYSDPYVGGRRGRIVAINEQSNGTQDVTSMDDSMKYIADEGEIEFRQDGKYVLTEITPPPGYTIPTVNGQPADTTTIVISGGTLTVTGDGLSHGAILLSSWNTLEASCPNEYSVALENTPIITKVKLQIVDSSGNVIANGTQDASLNLNGYTLQSGTNIDYAMTAAMNNSYLTATKNMEYGEYTITQSASPAQGSYKTADAVTLSILGDGTVQAEGNDLYDVVEPHTGTNQTDSYIVRIKNQYIGYNLSLSKTVVGDDNCTDTFTFNVTVDDYSNPTVSAQFANRQFTVYEIVNNQFVATNQTVNFASGSGTVSVNIHDGETLVLRSLPMNLDYIVTEADADQTTYRACRQSNYSQEIGDTSYTGPGVRFTLDAHILVEVTNDLTVIPAPTAVAQAAGTAFAELLMLCILGAGIYFVLSKRRKEVGCDAI